MESGIENQIAIVTGAAHGIGRATAKLLAEAGARVVLMDRDTDGLADAQALIGTQVTCIPVDLLDPAATTTAFAQAEKEFGLADILVNNVGQGARERASTFRASEPESWDFMIDICLKTTIACTHQVIGGMQDRKSGKIVNIASDSAYIGAKASAAYAAAKNGVIGFTRSLAREVARDGVSVNAVAPGYIRTRATDALPPEFVEKAKDETPMGHLGEPEDIARAVLFFAGPGSRYITGQSLIVNGGRWMN
jgi:NAD(P)-dependent dehydrogenase (short-subunit alcohol dehydrogenase family)